MVTPEMLLFLAGRMGLDRPIIDDGAVWFFDRFGEDREFDPHQSDAQFGRLVVWAAMQGLWVVMQERCIEVGGDDFEYWAIDHNNTPDSIRAAAVVAVCRALGWEEAANGMGSL